MKSISRTLIVSTLAAIAAVLLTFGFAFYLLICEGFKAHFDVSLDVRRDAVIHFPEFDSIISNAVPEGSDSTLLRFNTALDLERTEFPEDWWYVQIWNERGEVLYRSPTIGSDEDIAEFSRDCSQLQSEKFVDLPNGNKGRAHVFVVDVDDHLGVSRDENEQLHLPGKVMIAVAQDATPLFEAFEIVKYALATMGAASLLAVFLISWVITKRGVKPMSNLANEIEAFDESDPSARLQIPVPVELESIKTKLNEYLSRMEQAFKREKQFSDDVAHELKTPLSGMLVKLEYALAHNKSDSDRVQSLWEFREGVLQLDSLITRLLDASRIDSGEYSAVREPVDINESLQFIWDSVPAPAGKGFSVEWIAKESVELETDLLMFSQVMTNVVDNAKCYVDDGGTIRIQVYAVKSGARIEVSNTGCRLNDEEVDLVFSRLWRADRSRTNSDRHSGLGLSIAQRIVKSLSGTIAASTSEGWFFVKIQLPDLD